MTLLEKLAIFYVATSFCFHVWATYRDVVMMNRHDTMDSLQRQTKYWQDQARQFEDLYVELRESLCK